MFFQREHLESSLGAAFARAAAQFSDRPAWAGGDDVLTYRQLHDRVVDMAQRLVPGRGCVAYRADNSTFAVVAMLAIIVAGKAALGLHPELPEPARRDILAQAQPELMLAEESILDGNYSLPQVHPSDPAIVFYTSGSSGQAKGVVKSHRAVLHRVWLSTCYDAVEPGDRQSLLTSPAFASAEADVFCSLLQGACVCPFDVKADGLYAWARWLHDRDITLLHPPVLLLRRFLATLNPTITFPRVRLVALAGEVVLPGDLTAIARHFPAATVLHRFSTTETALLCARLIDRPCTGPLSVGAAVPDKDVQIIDGEVTVTSAYIADGYWRGTQFDTLPDGRRRYCTGDLARWNEAGELVYLGRSDDQVKIRGYRVSIREVEQAILEQAPGCEVAVTVDRTGPAPGLRAFVSNAPPDLRDRLEAILPPWKLPILDRRDDLPKTMTGKVDRQALQHSELTALWQQQLRIETVGVDDDFLLLGGDSLAMLVTLKWLETRHGQRLSMDEFLHLRTPRRLLARLERS